MIVSERRFLNDDYLAKASWFLSFEVTLYKFAIIITTVYVVNVCSFVSLLSCYGDSLVIFYEKKQEFVLKLFLVTVVTF